MVKLVSFEELVRIVVGESETAADVVGKVEAEIEFLDGNMEVVGVYEGSKYTVWQLEALSQFVEEFVEDGAPAAAIENSLKYVRFEAGEIADYEEGDFQAGIYRVVQL